ncbi:hypothetical protein FQZ97_901600 [compost metagenome]
MQGTPESPLFLPQWRKQKARELSRVPRFVTKSPTCHVGFLPLLSPPEDKTMTEHGYIRSIHRLLPKSVYAWKINDRFQGGVADAYYSGNSGDLWVEYKYLKALPKQSTTAVKIDLSTLQRQWLRARHTEGRRVAVVIGSPIGSLILEGLEWDNDISTANFIRSAVDKSEVAAYILSKITRV